MPNGTAPAALVTGGAQRIGGAIAIALARAGYAVAIHANRSVDAAHALCRKIVASGARAEVVMADLSDHEAVLALVGRATALTRTRGASACASVTVAV